jgi:pyrrolysine biosynthesis protein PylC
MRVAVLGGKLQGVEACYLAKKAGWEVVLVDKKPAAPAAGLCDCLITLDLLDRDKLLQVLRTVDFAVPALEDKPVLDTVCECAQAAGVRILYDREAYALSASKLASDQLFARLGIPAPRPWPDCQFPVTVKPSGASGSKGVRQVRSPAELNEFMQNLGRQDEWVIQEFLAGPSYSIEIAGIAGDYRTFQVTELEMDAGYDCKRVLAPAMLAPAKVQQLADCALVLARELQLTGIMDVEVILHDDTLKVLEIDARLPSQTLTAVYQSTGVNVLALLGTGFAGGQAQKQFTTAAARGVVYEHVRVCGDKIEVCGEHIMGAVGPLRIAAGFFGADEAITNFSPGKAEWVATLIVTGEHRRQAWQRREAIIKNIMQACGLAQYRDLTPPLPDSNAGFLV